MGKHYSDGAFLRRIRRTLMADGLEREIRLVPRPAYRPSTSPSLVEIRTALADGRVALRHHNTGLPGTPDHVERICEEQRHDPGAPCDALKEALSALGPALVKGEGMAPLATKQSWDMPMTLVAAVRLHDLSGRPHDVTAQIPLGDVPGYWRKSDEIQRLQLDMDRRRRDRRGRPRELMACGALAELMRRTPEGPGIVRTLRRAIEAAIDAGGQANDHTAITIDGLKIHVGGVPITVGPRGIRTSRHMIGGASLSGNVLTLPRRVPHAVAAGLAGRRLDEVVSDPPLGGDARILRATPLATTTAVTLDLKPVALRVIEEEIAGRENQNGP